MNEPLAIAATLQIILTAIGAVTSVALLTVLLVQCLRWLWSPRKPSWGQTQDEYTRYRNELGRLQ